MITLEINEHKFLLKIRFFYNNYMNLRSESKKKLKSNGNTVCTFTLENPEADKLVLAGVGYSRCSKSDMFSKRTGRYLAFARAVADAFPLENQFMKKFVESLVNQLPNITLSKIKYIDKEGEEHLKYPLCDFEAEVYENVSRKQKEKL